MPILTRTQNWRLILGMYLITSATELEIAPLKQNKELAKRCTFLVTGIGPVESAISLTRFLSNAETSGDPLQFEGLIVFGACGAYVRAGASVLDICLAEEEHFGDFGVAMTNGISYFVEDTVKNRTDFDLRNSLFKNVEEKLTSLKIPHKMGNFVTVNSCTGTNERGDFLRDEFDAICENMEGAAIARACELYHIPLAELRCVSNMVEDRDKSKWKVGEAISKGNEVLTQLLAELTTEVNK